MGIIVDTNVKYNTIIIEMEATMDNKPTQSKKDRRKARKIADKEFLDKYKDQAPKGPGFTWKGKLIYGLIFTLIVLGFAFGKSIYIGGTPVKLLDYSLTQSLNTNGRNISLTADIEKENPDESYSVNTNMIYSFEYLTTSVKVDYSNKEIFEVYLTNEELAFRNNEEQWYKYELGNINVAGLENVNWGSFGSVIDIRSIPDMKDILKDSVQFFMGSFYKRFTFGENEIIETLDDSYECKQINLTFTNKEFYPILKDFLNFNDNSIGIRTGVKDRIQRFLNVVDENDLYETFNLDKDTVKLYLKDLDYNYEITYYILVDYISGQLKGLEENLSDLNVEVEVSFYVDKKYNIRAVDIVYTDFDSSNDIISTHIYYVVNDFTPGYVESPIGAEQTIDMGTLPPIDLNDLTKDNDIILVKILMSLYNTVFAR